MGALVGLTHDLMWPAYYLVAAGIVGVIGIHFTREPNRLPMWGSAPAASSKEEAEEVVEELAEV